MNKKYPDSYIKNVLCEYSKQKIITQGTNLNIPSFITTQIRLLEEKNQI